MKKRFIIIFVSLILLMSGVSSNAAAASMTDYCQIPPFMSSAVPPNIFFTVDVSGSMSWLAYQVDGHGNYVYPYDSTKTYEGYFTPAKYYVNNTGVYQETSGTACQTVCNTTACYSYNTGNQCVKNGGNCKGTKPYQCCKTSHQTGDCNPQSGNYLNYLHMSKIDLVRWAMTGGTPATCTGSYLYNSKSCDPELYSTVTGTNAVSSVCNDSLPINDTGTATGGCTLLANDGTQLNAPWSRVNAGLINGLSNLSIQPRMGAMFFSNNGMVSTNGSQVYVGDFTSSNNTSTNFPYMNLQTALNSAPPGGSTPTGPAMQDTLNYFAQSPPQYGGIPVQTGNDVWKNPLYNCRCDPTNPAYPNCTGGQSICTLIPCAKNFVMLLSDGQWNQPTCGTSSDPVSAAYQMHEGFTNIPANYQTSISAVYTLGLFLSGTGDLAMKNIAMYGSFDTAHGSWPDSLTGYPSNSCTMDDCGWGQGSGCTPLPASSPDWDHNADGVPDTYYSANDALGIKDAIYNAIMDALRRVTSGTAVSILTSSGGSGANILQAVFYPDRAFDNSTDITWTSEMQNLWYYLDPYLQTESIREDSVPDKILDLSNDKIAEFFYDTTQQKARVHLWSDAGDGTKLNPSNPTTIDFEDMQSLWQAGSLLWQRDPSTRTIYTSVNGSSLIPFTTAQATTLQPYLQAASSTDATNIINFTRGVDTPSSYRNRTVSYNGAGPNVWKLGDIMSSTPQIAGLSPLSSYHLDSPSGYGDGTYRLFESSQTYQNRGMVYVGANDGMLHAFNLGQLTEQWQGQSTRQKAKLTGSNMGTEQWAYIPKNVLPYLTYLTEDDYCHLFYVDLTPTLADVSITVPSYENTNAAAKIVCSPDAAPSCSTSSEGCPKQTCVRTDTGAVDISSWETVLIGGMGFGGACAKPSASCSTSTDCVKAPVTDPSNSSNALGLSSYFAMKVTDQNNPVLLWEFSDPALGFSTSGPAIVRVGDRNGSQPDPNQKNNNGKWFVVLASGPTGPIVSNQFQGTSNQNLKIFILDLVTGALLNTIDTGIPNAFAGALVNAASDPDRWNPQAQGFYQDDALYFGYTTKDTSTGTWTKGGVLRLVTHESPNPGDWTVTHVIDNIGPVTAAVTKLQDRTVAGRGKLWLYFGSGRYYYKIGTTIDDADGQRALYGIKDPCYDPVNNQLMANCSSSVSAGSLVNQTSTVGTVPDSATGWVINLSPSSGTYKAERMVTDPTASPTGAVFFITYEPSADVCALEGQSFIWGVNYNNGGQLSSWSLQGEIMIQMSTGSIEERKLSSTFGSSRVSGAMAGKPPAHGPNFISPPQPTQKFMHLRER